MEKVEFISSVYIAFAAGGALRGAHCSKTIEIREGEQVLSSTAIDGQPLPVALLEETIGTASAGLIAAAVADQTRIAELDKQISDLTEKVTAADAAVDAHAKEIARLNAHIAAMTPPPAPPPASASAS